MKWSTFCHRPVKCTFDFNIKIDGILLCYSGLFFSLDFEVQAGGWLKTYSKRGTLRLCSKYGYVRVYVGKRPFCERFESMQTYDPHENFRNIQCHQLLPLFRARIKDKIVRFELGSKSCQHLEIILCFTWKRVFLGHFQVWF